MSEHLIQVALGFATQWHAGELRKYSGEPYIVHPIAVAELVRSVPHCWEAVAAALLHDVLEVIESIRIQRELVIRRELGEWVLQLVREVTNPSVPEDGSRIVRKAIDRAHLAKASPTAQTLRLADAIDNLKTLGSRAPVFAKKYAGEKQLVLALTRAGDPTLHARLILSIEQILLQDGGTAACG